MTFSFPPPRRVRPPGRHRGREHPALLHPKRRRSPVKIGFRAGHTFLSVHEDVYFKIPSMLDHVLALLERQQLADQVDMRKVMQAVEEH